MAPIFSPWRISRFKWNAAEHKAGKKCVQMALRSQWEVAPAQAMVTSLCKPLCPPLSTSLLPWASRALRVFRSYFLFASHHSSLVWGAVLLTRNNVSDSLRERWKLLCPDLSPDQVNQHFWACDPGIRSFWNSPCDSNMQPRLRTIVLGFIIIKNYLLSSCWIQPASRTHQEVTCFLPLVELRIYKNCNADQEQL